MASKRTKKSKQEQEIFSENSVNIADGTNNLETENNHIPIDNNSVVSPIVTKAPKRKKKSEGTEVPKKVKRTTLNGSENKKVKVKKKKVKSDICNENEENKQVPINDVNKPEVAVVQKSNKSEISDKKKEAITWPDQDIIELINRMETNIPDKDVLAYKSRIEKINWDNVSFKNYNAETCKSTWLQVQKRIRRFRLLREMLHDAKEWVSTPRVNKLARPRKHPDMPRRPLSSYLLFYITKKNEIISENPGLDGSDLTKVMGQIFKNLPPEKREKYEKMAATNREEYLEKLKIFFENHPECVPPQRLNLNNKLEKEKAVKAEKEKAAKIEKERAAKIEKEKAAKIEKEKPVKVEKEKAVKVEKEKVLIPEKIPVKIDKEKTPKLDKEKTPKVEKTLKVEKVKTVKERTKVEKKPGRPAKTINERPPKKWQTPFGLFYASELKSMESGSDKNAFREKCKELYKEMSDKKKVIWINQAEQDLTRYEDELKTYKAKYPEFKGYKMRSVLTKREKASKERASGKPVKPANSAYALYSRVMLQSDEIKSIHPKDRMNYIASKWKNCTEEEQSIYRDQVAHLMAQYKEEYDAYVDSLPEEEKRKIIQVSKSKRARSGRSSTPSRTRPPRKRKATIKSPIVKPTTKFSEPEQPPISACKYFATLYKGEGDAVQAWKSLNNEEKRKYEDELVKKKQAYIVEFEKFLKSLSPDELEAFSKSRQQKIQSDEEESSDCSSDSEAENEDDDDGDPDEHIENGAVHNDDKAHDTDSD